MRCHVVQAGKAGGASPVMHAPPMDIFQRLAAELDTEGRYLFLNALANQLRFPNSHTHYYSCVLLYIFAEAQQAGLARPSLSILASAPTVPYCSLRAELGPCFMHRPLNALGGRVRATWLRVGSS